MNAIIYAVSVVLFLFFSMSAHAWEVVESDDDLISHVSVQVEAGDTISAYYLYDLDREKEGLQDFLAHVEDLNSDQKGFDLGLIHPGQIIKMPRLDDAVQLAQIAQGESAEELAMVDASAQKAVEVEVGDNLVEENNDDALGIVSAERIIEKSDDQEVVPSAYQRVTWVPGSFSSVHVEENKQSPLASMPLVEDLVAGVGAVQLRSENNSTESTLYARMPTKEEVVNMTQLKAFNGGYETGPIHFTSLTIGFMLACAIYLGFKATRQSARLIALGCKKIRKTFTDKSEERRGVNEGKTYFNTIFKNENFLTRIWKFEGNFIEIVRYNISSTLIGILKFTDNFVVTLILTVCFTVTGFIYGSEELFVFSLGATVVLWLLVCITRRVEEAGAGLVGAGRHYLGSMGLLRPNSLIVSGIVTFFAFLAHKRPDEQIIVLSGILVVSLALYFAFYSRKGRIVLP